METVRDRREGSPDDWSSSSDVQQPSFANSAGNDGLTGAAFFIACSGEARGSRVRLAQGEQLIGRSQSCHIQIHDMTLSNVHARLVAHEDTHVIYDLDSSGIWVNNCRVRVAVLHDCDVIKLGNAEFMYQAAGGQSFAPSPDRSLGAGPEESENGNLGHYDEYGYREAAARAGITMPPSLPRPPHTLVEPRYIDTEAEFDVVQFASKVDKIWRFVKRNLLAISMSAIVFGSAGAGLQYLSPPAATAKFSLALHPEAVDDLLQSPRGSNQNGVNQQFFESAIQAFKRETLIEKTLIQIGSSAPTLEEIAAVAADLEISRPSSTGDTVEGKYHTFAEEGPLPFLTAHLRFFIETEIERTLQESQQKVERYRKERDRFARKLRETEASISEFKRKHIDYSPEQKEVYYKNMVELEQKKHQLQMHLSGLAMTRKHHEEQLQDKMILVEERQRKSQPYENAIAAVEKEIIDARAGGLMDDNPRMVALLFRKQQYQEKQDAILNKPDNMEERRMSAAFRTMNEKVENSRLEENIARTALSEVSSQLESVKKLIEKLPAAESAYTDLVRSHRTNTNFFERYSTDLATAEFQLELERVSANAHYEVLDAPTLVPQYHMKRVIKIGIVGFIAGLFFGIAIGLLRELLNALKTVRSTTLPARREF